ncbi:hypothetical protein P691DRAFT_788418 [Macrolepiota fuliginosa MF-IS2]|uniref:Uncharacterized protein n=1 Tax=Macrolepiota fuliginosa MF-IS2 TaxID=1400762 RepID=A0A9P6BZ37_9AGAR|nr:hypothetical protein P691DRAFT_788418 [Macrolepiota fuliginosa MF-IS2]
MSAQQQLLWEDLDLISSTTINGVLYGIALSLYVLAARSLYPQLKDLHQRRRAIFIFVYNSVVMICGIIFLALATRGAQLSYIDHNTFVGEPIEYQVTYLFSLPAGIAEDIFSTMIDILTLGIQIWRLWVIYSMTHYALAVIIFPLLLFLCFIGESVPMPTLFGQNHQLVGKVEAKLVILFSDAFFWLKLSWQPVFSGSQWHLICKEHSYSVDNVDWPTGLDILQHLQKEFLM